MTDEDFEPVLPPEPGPAGTEEAEPNLVAHLTDADWDSAMPPRAKYLVFDTETTGIFRFKDEDGNPVPADAPDQPRLASFCAIACDENGTRLWSHMRYIKPDGWNINGAQAAEVNGLSDEFLAENGVPVAEVLDFWEEQIGAGLVIVAHNAQFDAKMMRAELRRAGRPDLFEETSQICTMRGAAAAYKDRGLKAFRGMVKLQACCEFIGIPLTNAHDASADAEGCRALMAQMIRDGVLPEPKVYYAKKDGE